MCICGKWWLLSRCTPKKYLQKVSDKMRCSNVQKKGSRNAGKTKEEEKLFICQTSGSRFVNAHRAARPLNCGLPDRKGHAVREFHAHDHRLSRIDFRRKKVELDERDKRNIDVLEVLKTARGRSMRQCMIQKTKAVLNACKNMYVAFK